MALLVNPIRERIVCSSTDEARRPGGFFYALARMNSMLLNRNFVTFNDPAVSAVDELDTLVPGRDFTSEREGVLGFASRSPVALDSAKSIATSVPGFACLLRTIEARIA